MLFYLGRQRVLDLDVAASPGALANFYVSGTNNRADTWQDAALTIPHPNPVPADDYGVLPPIYLDDAISYKCIITDRDGNSLPDGTIDPVLQAQLTQDSIGTLLYPLTRTEDLSDSVPANFAYEPVPEDVRRYDAVDTGGDSAAEIQATADALNAGTVKGGAVLIPGDANSVYGISASITIPARASGDNHTNWYSIKGMGRGAPRIKALTGMANQPMLNLSGQDASTYSYYREVKDLYLQGAGIAQRGVELFYNQHAKVENVFINGLANGSGTAAGVRVFGAICSSFRDVKVHNTQGHGIYASDGSGNFFNANLVAGCSFLDLTGDGMNFTGGVSGCAFIGNTAEFCDGYGMRIAGYSGTVAFIGGNYFESNVLGDIYAGVETTANSLVIEGNYFNGYDVTVSDASHTPIKIKFGDGVVILGNMVAQTTKSPTGYLILDADIAGGSVSNCYIAYNQVRGLPLSTAPNTMYHLPGSWVNQNNTVVDPTFVPLIQANILKGRWPYGGWSHTITGSGLAQRAANDMFGAPAMRMYKPAASTSSTTISISPSPQMLGRFVTFALPIKSNASSKEMQIAIASNGTSPQNTTITDDSLASGKGKILYALGYIPTDSTAITLTITMNATDADYDIGHPCIYAGAQPWYSSAGDQDWRNDTAPTTGAWLDGDKVWLLNAVSGAKMGYVCSVAGSPGTWLDMPNYA